MMHLKTLLLSIFIIAILTTSSLAAIKTVTYPSTIDKLMVDWDENHSLPYFNPALGRLISVNFNAMLNASLEGKAENKNTVRGVTGCYISAEPATLSVEMINGDLLHLDVNLRIPATGTISVTNHITEVGEPKYTGTDSFNGTSINSTSGYVFYNTADKINAYIGTGTFNLAASAHASSEIKGGGNWWSDLTTYGWSNATITYTYDDSRCISGYKIDDCTGQPLAGWKIYVNNSTRSFSDTTNATGFWQVCGLDNLETFTICEEQKLVSRQLCNVG
ncbi:MAG: choice-of-anchor E domain-containing protein [Methanothrix sp.]